MTFTSNICRHWSERLLPTVESNMTPALLTRRSIFPNSSTALRTRAWACSSSAISHSTAIAFPLFWDTLSTSSSRRSLRRAPATTAAPSAASARTVASPMPLEAPVTTATLPSNFATLGSFPSNSVCGPRLRRRARLPRLRTFGILGEAEVGERPVGVVEGAQGAREHQQWHQKERPAYHGGDHARRSAFCGKEGYRGAQKDRPYDQEYHEHRYAETQHDGQLHEPREQAAPDAAAKEPEASADGLQDAPPVYDQLPQGELVDDREGQKDGDEGHDGVDYAEHHGQDPHPCRVREGEDGEPAERHRQEDQEPEP